MVSHIFACYLHNFVTKLDTYGSLKSTCNSPWKLTSGAENLILQALKFDKIGVSR